MTPVRLKDNAALARLRAGKAPKPERPKAHASIEWEPEAVAYRRGREIPIRCKACGSRLGTFWWREDAYWCTGCRPQVVDKTSLPEVSRP